MCGLQKGVGQVLDREPDDGIDVGAAEEDVLRAVHRDQPGRHPGGGQRCRELLALRVRHQGVVRAVDDQERGGGGRDVTDRAGVGPGPFVQTVEQLVLGRRDPFGEDVRQR